MIVIILERNFFLTRWEDISKKKCYVTSFISWFLEWRYRPVGGRFCINDGNDFKEYFVCFSYHHIYNCKLTHFKRTVGRIKFRGRFTQKALQRRQHHAKETVVKFLFEREDNLKLILFRRSSIQCIHQRTEKYCACLI